MASSIRYRPVQSKTDVYKTIFWKIQKSAFDPTVWAIMMAKLPTIWATVQGALQDICSVCSRPAWWIGPSHHQHCLFWLHSASTTRGQICLITGESCTAGLKNRNDYQNTSIRSTHPDLHVHTRCIPWTHGFTTASKRAAPYPAFHAFHSRPSYRYLLNSNSTSQRERTDAPHTPTPHIQYNNKLQVTHPKDMYIQTKTYIPMHICSCCKFAYKPKRATYTRITKKRYTK